MVRTSCQSRTCSHNTIYSRQTPHLTGVKWGVLFRKPSVCKQLIICTLQIRRKYFSLFYYFFRLPYIYNIRRRHWTQIQPNSAGYALCNPIKSGEIRCNSIFPTIQSQTRSMATLPISDEALELCGEVQGEGLVFVGLRRCMIQHPLHAWIKAAGIRKHITFHCFRHTFATLQIALGTDIYTVSKMLTHRSVKTTQIYADLVNSKKRESANRISLK